MNHNHKSRRRGTVADYNVPTSDRLLPAAEYAHRKHLNPFLHEPYTKPRKLDKALVESKLGNRECSGITAQELTAGKVSTDSTYVIRLHEDAPFGVVTWEARSRQATLRVTPANRSLIRAYAEKGRMSREYAGSPRGMSRNVDLLRCIVHRRATSFSNSHRETSP